MKVMCNINVVLLLVVMVVMWKPIIMCINEEENINEKYCEEEEEIWNERK